MAYITLNKNNFFHNLDIIAKHSKAKDKIALVLKDNAYGHGLELMASLAKEYGITKAVVRSHKEALTVERFFDYILVLADFADSPCDKARYTINDLRAIHKFAHGTKVELKVDTGMHRNGIAMGELREAFGAIKEQGLVLEGVFTHHRSADELTGEWFWQNENFKNVHLQAVILAQEFGFDPLRFHSCNSAALFRASDFSEDMARVGIAAYGCMELPQAINVEGFKPVLSVYANKISSRELLKGQCVGYGATHELEQDCTVSNYNFGYGEGFLRVCSNNFVTPHAKQLVGRISMDNSSFLAQEDEILIFDDATQAAKFAKTIAYEVLTSLKADMVRKIV